MSNPASAGPKMREVVISALLRLTAFWTWASGTISTTKARRAGLSKARTTPPAKARTYRTVTEGSGWKARVASAKDCTMATA